MSEAGVTQFNIRMPRDLIAALDDEVSREVTARPGLGVTRSDLIREALYEYIARRKEAREQAARWMATAPDARVEEQPPPPRTVELDPGVKGGRR